jgi:transglutaminase-like putative cysteine protease
MPTFLIAWVLVLCGWALAACGSMAPQAARSPSAATTPAATPGSHRSSVSQESPRRYHVEFVVTIRNEGFSATKLFVYQARPIAWDGQRHVTIDSVSPAPDRKGSDPEFGNGLYFWNVDRRIPAAGESLQLKMRFSLTAFETTSRIDPGDVRPYRTRSRLYALYTRPERFIESKDPRVVRIARKVGDREDNPYLLAKRFYDYVVRTARYRRSGEGLFGAKALLVTGEGECGDYASLFVALCRAKGIPARPIVGYWAKSGVDQTHVWAEFYLEGIGWVPVDPTVGQESGDAEYYFGNMDDQRVILHKGFNISMDPPAPGADRVALLQVPACWWWGSGGVDRMSVKVTGWNVAEASSRD